jgi:hypothetical protein
LHFSEKIQFLLKNFRCAMKKMQKTKEFLRASEKIKSELAGKRVPGQNQPTFLVENM